VPRERILQACILNVSANPHPGGIYVALLRRAADFIVSARGAENAKITAPDRDIRVGRYYAGLIFLWTEIDLKGRWLDIQREEELSPEEKAAIRIPPTAKPNFRTFNYVLDNERHLVYIETRNEFGQSLGASVARRIFSAVLSRELQGPESPDVEVTIVPEAGAVERILAIPGLRRLFIQVNRPNPDISDERRQRVWNELDNVHARRQEITFFKSSDAAALTPTDDIQELAAIAAENGEVRGEGREANGNKVEISTGDLPKRLYLGMDRGTTFLGRLLAALRG
jgi:hypothetical protein